jgi:hypothetical protein
VETIRDFCMQLFAKTPSDKFSLRFRPPIPL